MTQYGPAGLLGYRAVAGESNITSSFPIVCISEDAISMYHVPIG